MTRADHACTIERADEHAHPHVDFWCSRFRTISMTGGWFMSRNLPVQPSTLSYPTEEVSLALSNVTPSLCKLDAIY